MVDLGFIQLTSTQLKVRAVCQISGLKPTVEEAFKEARNLLYLKLKSTIMPNILENDSRLVSYTPKLDEKTPARNEFQDQTLFCSNYVAKFIDGKQAGEPESYGLPITEEKKS